MNHVYVYALDYHSDPVVMNFASVQHTEMAVEFARDLGFGVLVRSNPDIYQVIGYINNQQRYASVSLWRLVKAYHQDNRKTPTPTEIQRIYAIS